MIPINLTLRFGLAVPIMFWLSAASFSTAPAHAAGWAPVPAADLAEIPLSSRAAADVEILLSKHVMVYSDDDRWTVNHVRAKIHTQAGVDKTSVLKFHHNPATRIRHVSARVVKPGGVATELKSDQIFTQSVVKGAGVHLKATSFAFPDAAPGDVVEYRWEQLVDDPYFYTHNCQHSVPVRDFAFSVERLPGAYQVAYFNCPGAKLNKGSRNSVHLTMQHLAAFEEEPFMPPEHDERARVVVIFDHPFLRFGKEDNIWQYIGEYLADEFTHTTKPNDEISAMAAALTAGVQSDEAKIAAIYAFCQEQIENFDYFKSPELTAAEEKRNKLQDPPDARAVLAQRMGNSSDVNRVFGALARAAGFQTRPVISASRDEILNVRVAKGWLFCDRSSIAVRLGETWRFYSPGNYLLGVDMRDSRDEAVTAFVADAKKSWFEDLPPTPASRSIVSRKAKLKLAPDGSVSGSVILGWTGFPATELKKRWWGTSEVDAVNASREELGKRFATAEIADCTWKNLQNNVYPVIQCYNVHVAGYADSAGSRLIFPANFFAAGSPATLTTESRVHPIYLPHAWTELDEVEISLPDGFSFEWGSEPEDVGDGAGLITARYRVRYNAEARTIVYHREHVVGGNGALAFEQRSYRLIKNIFDRIHTSDTHRFVVKSSAP